MFHSCIAFYQYPTPTESLLFSLPFLPFPLLPLLPYFFPRQTNAKLYAVLQTTTNMDASTAYAQLSIESL